MKPQELFIGALCLYDTGDGKVLCKMTVKWLFCMEIEPELYGKRHSPIPLTPAVVGCIEGANKSKMGVNWIDIGNHYLFFGKNLNVNLSAVEDLPSQNEVVISLPHIKHIHQLQMLFFALTGEQMKIDLEKLKTVV